MTWCTVTKTIELDMGHRVPNHRSKCRHPHGHRYAVTACVAGPVHTPVGASDDGMVVDFGDLKAVLLAQVHDVYDHGMVVWEHDAPMLAALAILEAAGEAPNVQRVPFVPTAECLAEAWFHAVASALPAPLVLQWVQVDETPTCSAVFHRTESPVVLGRHTDALDAGGE